MDDISALVDHLESEGVFEVASILDPATLTSVALNLTETRNPNEYGMWLRFYADAFQVDRNELAAHVLVVLSNCDGHVKPDIAEAAMGHVRALAA
jgi:hypothetical protein